MLILLRCTNEVGSDISPYSYPVIACHLLKLLRSNCFAARCLLRYWLFHCIRRPKPKPAL